MRLRILAALALTALSIGSLELATHLLVEASPTSYGTFMGLDLPPIRLLRGSTPELLDPSTPIQGATAGTNLTRGDLWGHFRLDPQLGYTYQESVTSRNGWWQSNNFGARSRTNVERHLSPGRTRVLIFGESFAQGSRLPQEEAWPTIMQADDQKLE